jgi:hypothetical protein
VSPSARSTVHPGSRGQQSSTDAGPTSAHCWRPRDRRGTCSPQSGRRREHPLLAGRRLPSRLQQEPGPQVPALPPGSQPARQFARVSSLTSIAKLQAVPSVRSREAGWANYGHLLIGRRSFSRCSRPAASASSALPSRWPPATSRAGPRNSPPRATPRELAELLVAHLAQRRIDDDLLDAAAERGARHQGILEPVSARSPFWKSRSSADGPALQGDGRRGLHDRSVPDRDSRDGHARSDAALLA